MESIFKKKTKGIASQASQEPITIKPGAKFRTFAYYLAWLAFLSSIGSAVFAAIKDHEPPKKDDYYK